MSKSSRRRNERKEQATVRQESRNKLNNVDQIAVLDKRLGQGVGALKERQRLSGEKVKEVEAPSILSVEIVEEKEKFKVKKHQDPIKEKKKFRRQRKEKE